MTIDLLNQFIVVYNNVGFRTDV